MERFWLAAAVRPAMMSPLFNDRITFSEAAGFVDEPSRR